MKLIGNIRLGKDVELRHTSSGTAVATLFGAYNYGKKGDDGKRPSQWVEAVLWGQQAESLQSYLTKGEQFFVTLDDVHVETYEKRDGGHGVKLTGTVKTIDFVGGSARRDEGERPTQRQQPQRQQAKPAASGGFDDMDDDIPF